MLECFYPDEYLDSAYVVDYAGFYEKGFRGIIFDIDNTLVPHGAPADERSRSLFGYLESLGFACCLLSNNQRERVEMFNKGIDVFFVEDAHKPSRKGYEKAMKRMGTSVSTTLFVGDQLFTDVWGARRTGLYSILVKPIHPKEEIQIVLKRYLERIVLYFYQRRQK
ncbi:MAG: YqeG family HAD IIIA-type phosphatase [Lachnospiraceae bacterium]|nr:YqeG family HAD IIIA-type phosphatase [Lachnospiraceae bacterium]